MIPSPTTFPADGPLWRNRDFMLLWSGQAVSAIGTRITMIAFPLLVLALTHSPARAGIVGFAETVPFLVFQLFAGALVDRWNRKRIMLVADAARALALGSIALALAVGDLRYAQIVAVAFIEGTSFIFFYLSENAALPQIVPKEQLATAQAQNEARIQGATLVGQPLGGFLFGLGRAVPFLTDAISYAVSFVTLLFVRPSFQEHREGTGTRLVAEIAEGARFVLKQPFLRVAILIVSVDNFLFTALVLVLIVRAKNLGASPAVIGVMFAFAGASGILGSAVAPWIKRHVPARFVITGSLWLWATAALAYAFVPNVLALGALYGAQELVGPAFNVVLGSYRYALVPDPLLARVQSVNLTVGWGAIPLGSLVAGFMLAGVGARTSLLWLAAGNVALALPQRSALCAQLPSPKSWLTPPPRASPSDSTAASSLLGPCRTPTRRRHISSRARVVSRDGERQAPRAARRRHLDVIRALS